MKIRSVGLLAILLVVSACGETVVLDDPVTEVVTSTSTSTSTTSRPVAVAPSSTTSAGPIPTVADTNEGERFSDLPEAPEGFCADLATETAVLTVRIEELLADGAGYEARNLHALLSVSGDLLDWTANSAPPGMAVDIGLLRSVYLDLRAVLDELDPEMVTLNALRGELFTVLFESPMATATVLDRSAQRLSAFVVQSCGHGYPLMDTFADLFSVNQQVESGDALLDLRDG
ncbi:MAG TPA: hypothetical protein QGI67_09125 [Acidimicrobiales bacterium]|nr:hypothetical protein [Acidimicrobiales bacterium]